MTTTEPNVLVPAGAIEVGDWRLDGGTARHFRGSARTMQTTYGGEVVLSISGDQNKSGEVNRLAWLNGDFRLSGDFPLTAADSRELARALMAIGDELDRLSDSDGMIAP